jgi:hypothetical protein
MSDFSVEALVSGSKVFRLWDNSRHLTVDSFGTVYEVYREDAEMLPFPHDLSDTRASWFLGYFDHGTHRYVHD